MKNYIGKRILAAVLALGAAGIGATSAMAATITTSSATLSGSDVNTSWVVNYLCSAAEPCNGGTPYSSLRARTTYTLLDYIEDNGTGYWLIDLVIRNTSLADAGGFLTGVGFAADPDATVDSFWDANAVLANWTVESTNQFPGFSSTEICVYSGNNCADGSNHTMSTGQQDRVRFWLATDLSLSQTLSFTGFTARWVGNSVTGGSFEALGKVAPVPLPAAGGMLIAALGGLMVLRRTRKTAA